MLNAGESMNEGLKVKDLYFEYEDKSILEEINFQVYPGEFIGILGPNGSGKTTLLKNLNRWLSPKKGAIFINEENIKNFSIKSLAQIIATVPQDTQISYDFTVEEIVLMGRTPYLKPLEKEKEEDFFIAEKSMEAVGVYNLKHNFITQLSGGERQRALIARALTQQPKILLLDEPISHLDIKYKWEIMEILKDVSKNKGIIIIATLHDINIASTFCDKILMLKKGRIFKFGTPKEVITPENIREVFGVESLVSGFTEKGAPLLITFGKVGEKLNRKKFIDKVHVICGGGSGENILMFLEKKGYEVSCGVLNIGDSDWKVAKALNIKVAEELPFSPISEQSAKVNLSLMEIADAIILVNTPFGNGNLKNLQLLKEIIDKNKKVFVIEETPISERDYTNGKAEELYCKIKEKSIVISSVEELYEYF